MRGSHKFEMQLSTELLDAHINSMNAVVRYKEVCKYCEKPKPL